MKKFLIGGAVAAAVLFGGAGVAATTQAVQPAPATPRGDHARMAKPATRADMQSQVATAFAKLDANHDGFVSKQELDARLNLREQRVERFDPSKIFDRIDANHDGKITTAEAEAARAQRSQGKAGKPAKAKATAVSGLFARADTNKDGAITRAEFDVVGQQMKTRFEHAGTRGAERGARMFDAEDANKDGKVSLAEMQQAALSRFDRLDLNHDGTITPQERQQLRQTLKAQRKPS